MDSMKEDFRSQTRSTSQSVLVSVKSSFKTTEFGLCRMDGDRLDATTIPKAARIMNRSPPGTATPCVTSDGIHRTALTVTMATAAVGVVDFIMSQTTKCRSRCCPILWFPLKYSTTCVKRHLHLSSMMAAKGECHVVACQRLESVGFQSRTDGWKDWWKWRSVCKTQCDVAYGCRG